MEVFTTQGVAAQHKADHWTAILRGCAQTVSVWPEDPHQFDGVLTRKRVGRLALFEIRCASIRLQRLQQVRTGALRRPATYQVMMPVQGHFVLRYGTLPPAVVDAGSLCLIDCGMAYEIVHGDGLCAIGVELPRSMIEDRLPPGARDGGVILSPQTVPGRVLAGLLRVLGAELSQDAPLPAALGRSIAGIVAGAFADRADPAPRRGVKGRLASYRDYVESRLDEADLRPADIAREFGVTERYVRLVFQASGETLSGFVLRRRLEKAARLLRSDEHAAQSVTDIALECGFNTVSHFGSRFRQRFGVTPRDWRRSQS